MKIPFYGKRVSAEFEVYLDELAGHVAFCASDNKVKSAALTIYKGLFPLFLMLRNCQSPRGARHPTQHMLLMRMHRLQDKHGMLKVLRLPDLPVELAAAVHDSQLELRFTQFLQEMWSDSLLCLNSVLFCNYRGAYIALRCMLEDLYRHLYYKDHPQEYIDLVEGGADSDHARVAPVELRNYLETTSYLRCFSRVNVAFARKDDPSETDLFGLNSQLYSDASTYVHGSKFVSMNAFKDNGSAIFRQGEAQAVLDSLRNFVKMAVAFLLAAHLDEYRRMNEYDKSIIFNAFSEDEKHAFRKLLNI